MTLRIELFFEKHGVRIRLSGELRCEQLGDLRTEIECASHQVTLDLAEVDLVDLDAVWFLNDCEAQNIKVINCAPYIREWMFRERAGERNPERS
jgi:ABC-type transporter Mla MlaB component